MFFRLPAATEIQSNVDADFAIPDSIRFSFAPGQVTSTLLSDSDVEECTTASSPEFEDKHNDVSPLAEEPSQSFSELRSAKAPEGCGRPRKDTPFPKEEFLKLRFHRWNQAHPTRMVDRPAHICKCCNNPTPNLYKCVKCRRYYINVEIDTHESTCTNPKSNFNVD